jgi:hypothetical protein
MEPSPCRQQSNLYVIFVFLGQELIILYYLYTGDAIALSIREFLLDGYLGNLHSVFFY